MPENLDLIHLQSQYKGLKVNVHGGEMADHAPGGRMPRVVRPAAQIHFRRGEAVVEPTSSDPSVASWKHLVVKLPDGTQRTGATTRAEAVKAIRALGGYGVQFTITDVVVAKADKRAAVAEVP